MIILKFILSRPYLLFISFLLYSAYYYFSTSGLNALVVVIFFIFYFPLIHFVFSLIKYRLMNFFIPTSIDIKIIEGYLFILTYFLPFLTIPLALISKLFKINENKKFLYINNYGDTISGIRSANPTLIWKRDKGSEEETIIMTKYTRKKK